MVLEESHRKTELLRNYLSRDVDSYCENRPDAEKAQTSDSLLWDGKLAKDPVNLRTKLRHLRAPVNCPAPILPICPGKTDSIVRLPTVREVWYGLRSRLKYWCRKSKESPCRSIEN